MKTLVKTLKLVSLLMMTAMLANCAKSDGGSSNNNTGNYYWQNGQCLRNVNGQVTVQSNTSLCNNSGTNGTYYWENGQCVQYVNNQRIVQTNTALCNNTQNGSGQVCNGIHYGIDPATQQLAPVLCTPGMTGQSHNGQMYIINCSGLKLYNQYNQIVTCQ